MSVAVLDRVLRLINTNSLRVYDDYYRGEQPLAYLSAEVRAQVGDRIPRMVLNAPRVVIGSIEERLDVEGFGLTRNAEADEALLDIWQANDLDEWSQLCHIEALKHGISFVTVWAGDTPDVPRIAVESAHQMAVEYAPGTRTVQAAAKRWQELDGDGRPVLRAVLYLPDRIEHYSRAGTSLIVPPTSAYAPGLGSGWTLTDALANPLGVVPVVPFVNRPSLTDLSGESELRDVMPLTDGVNKLLSDMMVTSEFHAEPRRYATGMQVPREAQANAALREEVKRQWQDAAAGKVWVGGPGVGFGQFNAADLNNFKTGVDLILSKVAFITGLAPHMLGVTTDNPASAEAIRSSESPLIRRVRRKMRVFGGSWERVMRLALAVRDGNAPAETRSMYTIWANPETQTYAQDADAVTKLVSGDRPVITVRAGRERMGYSPTEIKRMEDDEARAAARVVTAETDARMEQARALVARDGLSLEAAMATVGLNNGAALQATGAPAVRPAAPVTG